MNERQYAMWLSSIKPGDTVCYYQQGEAVPLKVTQVHKSKNVYHTCGGMRFKNGEYGDGWNWIRIYPLEGK
ncbi:hypothetical protein SAMN04487969_101117 [Paenibacillus algorifonticola]|uniref:Uncharacterized protein n=1 Tax=Paenibacillus algorifonticola TaxID=684063 RepID=A0A1I1XV75_9BACL|nr:hypothetical protein SAMN04487969_101117 [Paenibacillus algorifonticola]